MNLWVHVCATYCIDSSLSIQPLASCSDTGPFQTNMHTADYLNGGTALHLAALNGHSRCIRILFADYIPSVPNFCNILNKRSRTEESSLEFDRRSLYQVINSTSDGGITALQMAALNGHVDSVHLLIELGASVSEVTVEDGTTIDLIGSILSSLCCMWWKCTVLPNLDC